MAESADNGAGDGKKIESEASQATDSAAFSGTPTPDGSEATAQDPAGGAADALPIVEAPRLGAGEEVGATDAAEPSAAAGDETRAVRSLVPFADAAREHARETAAEAPGTKAPNKSSRFVLLAASIALAAGIGSFVGTMSASGVAQFFHPAAAQASKDEELSATAKAMKAQFAELAALKANLDTASRNTASQFARLADRLDHLDKRVNAAPEITGSIASAAPTPPAPPPPAAEPLPPVLDGWIVQDVQNGRALIANRRGGIFDVGTGSFLPGLGRIEAIKRQNGEWIVVTARGTILSMR